MGVAKRGRSLIERIQIQMDKRRKTMERIAVETELPMPCEEWLLNKGRYEGLAAALAILRSSSVAHEVSLSNERLGIE